jgi:pimeloyl-ACP methyl ester carboxylesterase
MARPLPGVAAAALRAALRWQWGWWALRVARPRLLGRIMGVPKGWPTENPELDEIRDSLFPTAAKRDGVVFDVLVSEPACNTYPLEDVAVPTLLVHAADDTLAPYRCAPTAAARIPGARLVTVDRGGHLYLDHLAELRAATRGFVREAVVHGAPVRS